MSMETLTRNTVKMLIAIGLAAILGLPVTSCDKSTIRLHHLYLTANRTKLAPGDTTQMEVHFYPDKSNDGFPSDTAEIWWHTSDTTIATVTQTGLVRTLKYGTVVISVTYGPHTAEKTLNVSEIVEVDDEAFMRFMLRRFDVNGDSVIEGYETSIFTSLDLSDLHLMTTDTVSLSALHYFPNLQSLSIANTLICDVDLSMLSELRNVNIRNCGVDTIDLRWNAKLQNLTCFNCEGLKAILLGSMAEYGVNALQSVDCHGDDLSEIDLTRCGETLWDLDVSGNTRMTQLDLTADTMITTCKYSCETTEVTWPTKAPEGYIIKECK